VQRRVDRHDRYNRPKIHIERSLCRLPKLWSSVGDDNLGAMSSSATANRSWVPRPFGPRWLRNWLARHQHPVSFVLHVIGIPMTIAALPFLIMGEYWWMLGLFLGGYFLQWVGHKIEGNDVGEIIPIKRLLGLPYVAISPRFQNPDQPASDQRSASA